MDDLVYYYKSHRTYKPLPKYPAQIEDLTFKLPEKTKVSNLLKDIITTNKRVIKTELTDIYNDAYTFRVWYQDPKKTLTDEEVEKVRSLMIKKLSKKYGATQKN